MQISNGFGMLVSSRGLRLLDNLASFGGFVLAKHMETSLMCFYDEEFAKLMCFVIGVGWSNPFPSQS